MYINKYHLSKFVCFKIYAIIVPINSKVRVKVLRLKVKIHLYMFWTNLMSINIDINDVYSLYTTYKSTVAAV